MEPGQVRILILEDHARLRALFRELDQVAARVLLGEGEQTLRLRALAEGLRERFLRHLDLEDRVLVPAIRQVDARGPERAARIAAEHRDQRARLARLLEELCDPRRTAAELAAELRALVAELLDDMVREEDTVLREDLLRDDVVEPDLEAG